jgi:hypothetical protein
MSDTSRPAEKPTNEWVTGDEPMTGPQESYLQTLAREAGEDIPANLTKAQASEMIDRLQSVTGRGQDSGSGGSGSGGSGGSGGSAGSGGSGGSGGGSEHLGEKAEREGIVDQQAALLDQIEDAGGQLSGGSATDVPNSAGMDPSESANPT